MTKLEWSPRGATRQLALIRLRKASGACFLITSAKSMHLLVKLNGIGGGREPPNGGRRLGNVMTWFTQRRTRRGKGNDFARRRVRKANVRNAKAFLILPLQLSPSSFQVMQI
jgi:hypothetical protein